MVYDNLLSYPLYPTNHAIYFSRKRIYTNTKVVSLSTNLHLTWSFNVMIKTRTLYFSFNYFLNFDLCLNFWSNAVNAAVDECRAILPSYHHSISPSGPRTVSRHFSSSCEASACPERFFPRPWRVERNLSPEYRTHSKRRPFCPLSSGPHCRPMTRARSLAGDESITLYLIEWD